MLDLGISKLALIGAIALIVIGPEKLPQVARTVGALLGKAQRYVNQVKAEVSRNMAKICQNGTACRNTATLANAGACAKQPYPIGTSRAPVCVNTRSLGQHAWRVIGLKITLKVTHSYDRPTAAARRRTHRRTGRHRAAFCYPLDGAARPLGL